MAVTVKTIGFERALKKMDAQTLVEPIRREILQKAGEYAREDVRGRAPVRTGKLAGSFALSMNSMSAKVASPVYYGRFVEFGTKRRDGSGWRIRPRRFLAKTRTLTRKELYQLIKEAIEKVEREWAA